MASSNDVSPEHSEQLALEAAASLAHLDTAFHASTAPIPLISSRGLWVRFRVHASCAPPVLSETSGGKSVSATFDLNMNKSIQLGSDALDDCNAAPDWMTEDELLEYFPILNDRKGTEAPCFAAYGPVQTERIVYVTGIDVERFPAKGFLTRYPSSFSHNGQVAAANPHLATFYTESEQPLVYLFDRDDVIAHLLRQPGLATLDIYPRYNIFDRVYCRIADTSQVGPEPKPYQTWAEKPEHEKFYTDNVTYDYFYRNLEKNLKHFPNKKAHRLTVLVVREVRPDKHHSVNRPDQMCTFT